MVIYSFHWTRGHYREARILDYHPCPILYHWDSRFRSSWLKLSKHFVIPRHGPKPGCHEAEAEAFSILEAEAEALTHFSLEAKAEAEAFVKKPKPGYLYSRVKFSKADQFLQLPKLQAHPIKPQGNIQ